MVPQPRLTGKSNVTRLIAASQAALTSLSNKDRDRVAEAMLRHDITKLSPARSSSIRKAMRFARILAGLRDSGTGRRRQIVKSFRNPDGTTTYLTLHPTKGYSRFRS